MSMLVMFAGLGLLLPAIIWTYSVAGTGTFTPGGILEGHIAGPAVGLLLGLFVFGIGKAAVIQQLHGVAEAADGIAGHDVELEVGFQERPGVVEKDLVHRERSLEAQRLHLHLAGDADSTSTL